MRCLAWSSIACMSLCRAGGLNTYKEKVIQSVEQAHWKILMAVTCAVVLTSDEQYLASWRPYYGVSDSDSG